MSDLSANWPAKRLVPAGPDTLGHSVVVTAAQMRAIEAAIFEAGMPIPALMEKVALRIADWVKGNFPASNYPHVGVLVGPGHNGGDALVVARELGLAGYAVQIYCPFSRLKPLTADHLRYAERLGLAVQDSLPLSTERWTVDVWIDGLFGFGLERAIEGDLADLIATVNQSSAPVVSIDVPSGLHTDTGAVLGTAIRASHTLCLGLWKRAFCQDIALDYLGQTHLIEFDIPPFALEAGLDNAPQTRRLTQQEALAHLPLPRPRATHKYRVGALLLVAGSRQYAGAALLAGLGARASGVGMLTLAVPESLRLMVVAQLPEALVIGCEETETGAIAALPPDLDLRRYDAIAVGPGLSRQAGAVVEALLSWDIPLLIDADGLNALVDLALVETLAQRSAPTVLTPHPGEFQRLFPGLSSDRDAGARAQAAAAQGQSIVVLKGACTAIAHPDGRLWWNPHSTPALARGGSGDILTGLVAGLLAQGTAVTKPSSLSAIHPSGNVVQASRDVVCEGCDIALGSSLAGVWWHAHAARHAAHDHTELGVDSPRLAQYLTTTLAQYLDSPQTTRES